MTVPANITEITVEDFWAGRRAWCNKCQKTVEEMELAFDHGKRQSTFSVTCHGETWKTSPEDWK